jgi:hypothetical protein
MHFKTQDITQIWTTGLGENVWKNVDANVLAYFQALSQHLPQRVEAHHEKT